MRANRIVLLVVGVVAGMIGAGLAVGGGALLWAHTTQRDADGFYATSPERFATTTHAITSEEIDLGAERAWTWGLGSRDWATARIEATSAGPDVFVGIGPERAVAAYLADVAHDEIDRLTYRPFEVTYRRVEGARTPAPPGQQDFWVESDEGAAVEMRWDVEPGRWMVVVMHADGGSALAVDAALGVRTGVLLPIGLALLAIAGLFVVTAVVLLVLGAREGGARRPPASSTAAGSQPYIGALPAALAPDSSYPVRLDGHLQADLSRWLWLVKWFLAIPHFIVLAFLWMAFAILTVVAGVSIAITGRYPRGIFSFNVGVMRWTWRTTFYAFTLGTDRYPPFSLDSDPSYPADFDVAYPERLSRGLVWVKWWLLAIPHYLIISVFGGGLTWWTWSWAASEDGPVMVGGGLIGLLVVVAAVILAFTARYPETLFDFIMGMQRWIHRVIAYAALMRDEYPPFRLDPGGTDPASAPVVSPEPQPDRGGDLVGV